MVISSTSHMQKKENNSSLGAKNLNASHFRFTTTPFKCILKAAGWSSYIDIIKKHQWRSHLDVLHIKKKIRHRTRDKAQPCQHTDLEPLVKWRVCKVKHHTSSHTKINDRTWALNSEMSLYYIIIMHHWLVQVFNWYGMRSVTGW